MKPKAVRLLPHALVLCFAAAASEAHGEAFFTSGALTSDAQSGISTSKTYTVLADVGGATSSVVVNGVAFAGGTTTGTNWSQTGAGSTYASGGIKTSLAASQNIRNLYANFQYGGNPTAITLSGLTVGKTYTTTIYAQNWNAPTSDFRTQSFAGTEGGSVLFSEDELDASMLRYTFVASAATMTLTGTPLSSNYTLHFYGFTNEDVFNKAWTSGTTWTTSTWSTAGAPNAVAASASFAPQGAPTTINLDANQTIGNLQFDGTNAWTLSSSNGSVLTLQSDAVASALLSTPSGSHVISAGIALAGDARKMGAGTLKISGPVTGTGAFVINNGLLQFGASNIYSATGALTVNSGLVVDLNDTVQTIPNLAGSGTVTNNGTAAKILTIGSGNFSGTIADHTTGTGTIALTKSTSGTLTIKTVQAYSGNTVVSDGTLRLEGSSAPLLTDNFFTPNAASNTALDYNAANRQTGSAATKSWTSSGNNQVGNNTAVQQPAATAGNYLLLAGGTATLASFPLNSTNSPGPLKINFDMFKGSLTSPAAGDDTNWTSFALRTTSGNGQPTSTGASEFGFLTRRNGGVQMFNSNVAVDTQNSPPAGDNFSFYLTDNTGTGTPFGSGGTRVVVAKGSTVLGSYKLASQLTTGYLNFSAQTNKITGMDNLGVYPSLTNLLPATTNLSLTSSTAAVQLENVSQTVAKFDGVTGSSVDIGPISNLIVNGTAGSTFAGTITGGMGTLTKLNTDTLSLTNTASTYGGTTIITGGILNVASVANFGANSSLGNRVADQSGDVGILFRGGTLQYNGSTPQSTNRGIRLSTTGGGGIIDASGTTTSATLSFTAATTADFFENSGTRGLTLTGTNTGANTFNIAIGVAGTTNFAKAGAGTWFLTSTASSYNGVSAFQGGILNVASLSDYGANSSLGNRASDASGNVGLLFQGGTLQYTGSTPQSTNRAIRVSTTGGGGTIDASGSVPTATLSFTAATTPDFFENSGSRGLVFTGTNTGANTFNIAMGDAGNVTNITKNGPGTWVFSGTNTYGGTTNITAGILRITNSAALGVGSFSATTKTTISAGATLEMVGNLTIPEHIHLQGTGMGGIGAIHSVSGTSTLNQQIGLDADTTIGVDADTLTISSIIYHDSGSFGLTKTGAGTLALTGVNSYTGTTTVSAGTLAVNGSSIVDSGKLVISGGKVNIAASANEKVATLFYGATQQPSGTYGSSSSAATFKDDTRFSGTGVLTVGTTPYTTWIAGYPTITGTNQLTGADPDGDGFSNLIEYAFGTDPTSAVGGVVTYSGTTLTAHGQPTTSLANVTNNVDFRAVFGRRKDYVAAGLTYTPEFSADLTNWVASAATPTVVASDATMDAVTVPYPLFIPTSRGVEKPTFFRIRITGTGN